MPRVQTARSPDPREAAFDGDEPLLVAALRRREEAAFVGLVRRYNGLMLRVARAQLGEHAAAEEVVQETWLAVIKGIDSFDHREPGFLDHLLGRRVLPELSPRDSQHQPVVAPHERDERRLFAAP